MPLDRLIAFDVDSTLLRVESLDTALEAALKTHPDGAEARRRRESFLLSRVSFIHEFHRTR